MYDITVAMTGHIATLLSEQDLSSYFAKSPEKSIGLFSVDELAQETKVIEVPSLRDIHSVK